MHIVLQSDTYLNNRRMSTVAAPWRSASTRSMHEPIHLIWIDSRACDHSSQTHSTHGPTCFHFASGIINAISKSSSRKVKCVRDKTLKKDDKKAYPEVAPYCPLSNYICCVGSKSVVNPSCGKRGRAIALSDLTRVVHMDEDS
jgi:hypothetical protein